MPSPVVRNSRAVLLSRFITHRDRASPSGSTRAIRRWIVANCGNGAINGPSFCLENGDAPIISRIYLLACFVQPGEEEAHLRFGFLRRHQALLHEHTRHVAHGERLD